MSIAMSSMPRVFDLSVGIEPVVTVERLEKSGVVVRQHRCILVESPKQASRLQLSRQQRYLLQGL